MDELEKKENTIWKKINAVSNGTGGFARANSVDETQSWLGRIKNRLLRFIAARWRGLVCGGIAFVAMILIFGPAGFAFGGTAYHVGWLLYGFVSMLIGDWVGLRWPSELAPASAA
jgi:hypothetical protein